jgi:hypothetical protein
MEAFKIKNGISATRYLGSNGTETAGSVGYDLAGASYDSVSQVLLSSNTGPNTFTFNNNGTKLFCQDNNDRVYEYLLSTAYDITTASIDSNLYLGGQTTSTSSMLFNADGTTLYIAEFSNDTILEYSLSTGFDVSTSTYVGVALSISAQVGNPVDLLFSPDGSILWVSSGDAVFQYNLSTAYDVSTASYASKSLTVSNQGMSFNADGTQFIVLVTGGQTHLKKYDLTTAYDISTATLDASSSFDLSTQDGSPTDILFYNNGQKLLMLGASNDTIYQYSTVGYTQTLDLATGTTFSFTPSGATTVSFTNPPASGNAIGFSVEINGDGSAITWPDSVKWHGGAAPTRYAGKELYAFVTTDGGTTYYGRKAAEDIA